MRAIEINKKTAYIGIAVIGVVALGLTIYLSRDTIYKYLDYRTWARLQTLNPTFKKKVAKMIKQAAKEGMELRVISAYRDCEQQNRLYAQGRTIPGNIVTNAKCGQSSHNIKRAVDVVEFKNGVPLWKNPHWERIGELGEAQGLEWGGRWRSFVDKPHFQNLEGRSIASHFRELQTSGELA